MIVKPGCVTDGSFYSTKQDVQHTCQICHENVVWHADTITRHLEAAHNITTAEYAAAHMATYK